jgi:hypothetical protein
LVLAIYGNLRYSLGRSPHVPHDGIPPEKGGDDDPFFRVGFTPFTANIIGLFAYWGLQHLLQIVFVAQYYFAGRGLGGGALGSSLGSGLSLSKLGAHFSIFNVLQFVWSVLFAHGHYIWAELFVIANFFNLLVLYSAQKTYKIKDLGDYIVVHLGVAAMPFSWLLYALFWNGAVVVGSNSLAARIVANVFIWDFLLVPGFALVVYRDWAVGLSSSFIVLALAFGQLFTRWFALQWIFAFVISGLLFLSSIAVWTSNLKNESSTGNAENAPLINN